MMMTHITPAATDLYMSCLGSDAWTSHCTNTTFEPSKQAHQQTGGSVMPLTASVLLIINNYKNLTQVAVAM